MAGNTTTRAIEMLKRDGIIAHQTDTVYGLACLPREKLLQRLTDIKHRHHKQGFILLTSQASFLSEYIDCTAKEIGLLGQQQPRPTTWLVNPKSNIAPALLGNTGKIAVRITAHQTIKQICNALGAIASTSANISNLQTCSNASQIRRMFGPCVDHVEIDSIAGTGLASKIVDLQTGQVIRN